VPVELTMGERLGALVKPRPVNVNSAENILPLVEDMSNTHQNGRVSIALFCNKSNALRVLYFANVTPNVGRLASVIGSIIYGTSLPCRVIRMLRGDFRCLNRCNGKLQMMNSAKRTGWPRP